ncbi:fibrinogen-like protein A [Aedes albopictus]|uniref:Fibrinogen C-terminal domain-containing protein n=1 Tax=Aedes albopictus TaxID=7160 RepID=A0ABM1ZAN0_AEDAL|nr:fibrinogen-like protein A [Aedes albopictus]
MKFITVICVFCAIRYHEAAKVSSDCSYCTANTIGSIDYEVLLGKLEDIEVKFWNMWLEMKEQTEKVNNNHIRSKDTHNLIMRQLTRLEQVVGHNMTTVMERSSEILQQSLKCANRENWKKSVLAMQLGERSNRRLDDLKPFKSCSDVSSSASGRYKIHPMSFEEPFEVYCEQKVFGGGWIVVQHRFDGSVDFYRNWTEYKNGFGSLDGEFWIGLEKLHRLTKGGDQQLLVELKEFNGNHVFARYDEFEIGTESEKYALKKLGSYSGTAGDSLHFHQGKKFSTKDNDNDLSPSNCAEIYTGAWWYNACLHSNLNGLYKAKDHGNGMGWYHLSSYKDGLAYSRMMIRKAPNNIGTCPWIQM